MWLGTRISRRIQTRTPFLLAAVVINHLLKDAILRGTWENTRDNPNLTAPDVTSFSLDKIILPDTYDFTLDISIFTATSVKKDLLIVHILTSTWEDMKVWSTIATIVVSHLRLNKGTGLIYLLTLKSARSSVNAVNRVSTSNGHIWNLFSLTRKDILSGQKLSEHQLCETVWIWFLKLSFL